MSITGETRAFKWEPFRTPGFSRVRGFLNYARSVLVGSKVYIFGETVYSVDEARAGLTRVICIDICSSQAARYIINGPSSTAALVALYRDSLYYYGGAYPSSFAPSKVSRFDPILGEFEACEIRNDMPLPSKFCNGAVIEDTAEWVMFGGEDENHQPRNLVFLLDLHDMVWRRPSVKGTPPEPRIAAGHCLHGKDFYIYGGVGSERTFSDLFVLRCNRYGWRWNEIATNSLIAQPLYSHTMAYVGGKIFVYGGDSPSSQGVFLVFDIQNSSWSKVAVISSSRPQKRRRRPEGYTIRGELPRTSGHTMQNTAKGFLIMGGSGSEWRFISADE